MSPVLSTRMPAGVLTTMGKGSRLDEKGYVRLYAVVYIEKDTKIINNVVGLSTYAHK